MLIADINMYIYDIKLPQKEIISEMNLNSLSLTVYKFHLNI